MRAPARRGARVRSDAVGTHRSHRELETPRRRRRRPSCPIDPPRRRNLTRTTSGRDLGRRGHGVNSEISGLCRPTRFGKRTRYFVKEKISRGFVSEKSYHTLHGLFRVQTRHIKFGESDKAYREKRAQSKSEAQKRNDNWRQKFKFHPKSDNARLLEVSKPSSRCGFHFLHTTQPESD